MGPFELLDLTGLDVSHPVMESIYNQFYHEDRYRPHPLTRQMLIGKKLGRKVGQGFYQYQDGQKVSVPLPQRASTAAPITSVWIGADLASDKQQLIDYLNTHQITIDDNAQPNAASLVLLAVYGEDTTTAALRYQVDPKQAVAIDMLNDLANHRTLMPSLVTTPDFVEQAYTLFSKNTAVDASRERTEAQASVINESVGFVTQRVLAMVINLGCDIAAQQIASPQDIDNAVKLGLGYPFGPLSWGDKLGAERILLILSRIYALTGDPRYRPSPWLYRRAKLGVSLFTQQSNS